MIITKNNIKDLVNKWIDNPDDPQFTDTTNDEYVGHISDWDVSKVTKMDSLFYYKSSFNEDISKWDVLYVRFSIIIQ